MSTLEKSRSLPLPTGGPTPIRRKQVREAQRAYRSRQKSLVDSLRVRVTHLEETLDNIRQIVNAFEGQIIQSKNPPSPPKHIQTVDFLCQQISTQIEQSKHTKGATNEALRLCGADYGKEFGQKLKDLLSQPDDASSTRNSRLPLPVTWDPKDAASDFWSLFFGSKNALLPSIIPFDDTNSTNSLLAPNHCRGIPDRVIAYPASSFTQKVYYACAQSGYRYLCDLRVTDKQAWPEFGLVLEHLPRHDIISYFDRVLKQTPCAPVEDPCFPFISLGGAGTHFLPDPQADAGESPTLQQFQRTNGVWEVACQEEYFDVEDVERYLKFNGIRLSGQQNFLDDTFDPDIGQLTESDSIDHNQINTTSPVLFVDEQTLIEGIFFIKLAKTGFTHLEF